MIGGRFRFAALACLVSVLSSCDVATVEQAPSSIAQNRCGADSDCAGGSCVNGQCRSRTGTIQTILLEVTPPADGTSIAGVQFLKPNITLPSADAPLVLDLDLVSQVVGRVIAGNSECAPKFPNDVGGFFATTDDSSIPAFVTLTPTETALGLYSPHSVVKSKLVSDSYFTFSVNVPPGDYDIYVEPGIQADDSCPVPPQLRRSQHLNGGSIGLKIQLPEPSSFEFHVSWPLADGALNGWFVDMLDPVSGRVLSNRVKLAIAHTQKTGYEYAATLSYSPVVVGETSGEEAEELLRLSPPDGVTAPTVLLARSALGLSAANKGTLGNFTSLPTPIHLKGQVAAQSTARPVASTVTLVATKIAGVDLGVLASFVRTAVVGKDGQFELDLLPGTYRVSAVPSVELDSLPASNPDPNLDSRLAEATETWMVPTSPSMQAGKLVTLGNALVIKGNVRDASGNAVSTALVQAVASPASLQSDVLQQLLRETSLPPRASTDSVAADGSFALRADSGTFDVTVRPLAGTGFGWLVFPNVGLTPANVDGLSLGTQTIPLPVSYSGTVTTPGGTTGDKPRVPNALIRAYIYMSKGEPVSDSSKADSVLQVAETRANADGAFDILIPAAVNALQ